MEKKELLEWILKGDPAIVYKAKKEIMNTPLEELEKIKNSLPYKEGYIKTYLSNRDNNTGMWGGGIYTPKWISTHYTLLELKNMGCPGDLNEYRESAIILTDSIWKKNGDRGRGKYVDLCVAAMIGSILCHGKIKDKDIYEIIDYILEHIQKDGGFNCFWYKSSVSSINTTLTVLQFFYDVENNGYSYRSEDIKMAVNKSEEWILSHYLYKRKSTGEPMHKMMINMPYPGRYKYDFLKGLEYFADRKRPYDERMKPALDLLKEKRLKSGAWPSTGNHRGLVYVKIEDEGRDNRINTVRALKVINFYR